MVSDAEQNWTQDRSDNRRKKYKIKQRRHDIENKVTISKRSKKYNQQFLPFTIHRGALQYNMSLCSKAIFLHVFEVQIELNTGKI